MEMYPYRHELTSGRLPAEETRAQITQIRTSRAVATARRDLRQNGGYARALKSRRQLRYAIRLSALLAELCRIVHR
jgi:hypothetical protein